MLRRIILRVIHSEIFLCVALAATIGTASQLIVQAQNADETVYKAGEGVMPPRAIYTPEPMFSEEARAAHYQGVCVLSLIVGTDGSARNIKVINPIGMGLDQNAIETVHTWKFQPAKKNGEPVAFEIKVEVDFHLYGPNDIKVANLTRQANAGDAKAQLDLAHIYFAGKDVGKNDDLGEKFLRQAANQGLPQAQFELGDRLAHHDAPDLINAYMWLTLAHRAKYKHSDKALKELSSKMTTDQQQQGRSLADNWAPEHK